MPEAAIRLVMEASNDLLFVGGEDPHTLFSLTTELRPCLAEPPVPNGDLVALRPGTLLICGDDDVIARKGLHAPHPAFPGRDSMVLDASYEETASVVETVLAEAATSRGVGNAVCVLNHSMEYAAGTIRGTDLTAALRAANNEPSDRKMYREIGASGTLGKDLKAASLVSGQPRERPAEDLRPGLPDGALRQQPKHNDM